MPWPRSIRFRYSLRALLVLLTLFAIWGGYHTNLGLKERSALEVFRGHGGAVISYDSLGRRGPSFLKAASDAYMRVVRLIWGEQFLTSVQVRSLAPEVLEALDSLPHLQEVGVSVPLPRVGIGQPDAQYEDGAVEDMPRLPSRVIQRLLANRRLKSLVLSGWILSDDDCRAISGHHSIEGLTVVACEVSEEGFGKLMTLRRLYEVNLSYCNVTGSNLRTMLGLESLERVNVQCTSVEGAFAAWVARCPNVKFLHLRSDTIDDDFLVKLGPHRSLAHVSVYSSALTDNCITTAIQWPSLQDFTANITSNAKACMRKSRPDVLVQ